MIIIGLHGKCIHSLIIAEITTKVLNVCRVSKAIQAIMKIIGMHKLLQFGINWLLTCKTLTHTFEEY